MSKAKHGQALENFVLMFLHCLYVFARICFYGLRHINFKSVDIWGGLFLIALYSAPILFWVNQEYSSILIWKMPFFFTMPFLKQYMLLMTAFLVIALAVYGFRPFRRYIIFQKAIERAGLKTATGEIPKIKSISSIGNHRFKVVVETVGVGISKFEAKKDSLTAGFRQKVEDIAHGKDMGKVEIVLCERDLPKIVGFHELYTHIKKPYSFIIGQSLKETMVQQIQSLPHLLISGATGGGKSVFFRSTMLSLLKSSPHIQLYLLDLKRGVEVKEFSVLPNVKTAKDETEATNILESLVVEMHRRYQILEGSSHKSIDPVRDKLDLIVVGIDEAAALFGKGVSESASDCMGKLASLARAAGIHLILSTQKPVKEAISTKILDNLSGRMTFRMISTAASNVAMGGNYAQKLPAIKGRAMWSNGSEHKQVQAPYVDDELVEEEIEGICQEFENGTRQNFSQLLGTGVSGKIVQAEKHAQS